MAAVWLKTNRRALGLGMILPAAIAAVGLAMALVWEHAAARVGGGLLALVGLSTVGLLAWQMRQPRLAYEPGFLLVYLRGGGPVRVPLEVVEGFLLGQAPSMIAGRQHEQSESASVVVRLADAATEWKRVDVKPALGKWCEGYITIRGTWCEPLNVKVVQRLNALLDEAQRSPATQTPAKVRP